MAKKSRKMIITKKQFQRSLASSRKMEKKMNKVYNEYKKLYDKNEAIRKKYVSVYNKPRGKKVKRIHVI